MAKAAAPKLSGTAEVLLFLDTCQHPLKPAMEYLRALILASDKAITEHIKWNGPSFCYGGDDRITFNLHKNDQILIVFHRGAKGKETKGAAPLFADGTGLLQWLSNERAVAKFASLEEVQEKKTRIKKVVKDWLKATG